MNNALPYCLAWVLLTSSTCLGGVVINGSFEGGLSDWSTIGLATVETSAVGVTPADANNQALIRTNDGASGDATIANLAAFLSIPVSELNASGRDGVRGSGLKQVITSVNAGDKLTFSWNYLTSETPGSPTNNDFAFFSVSRAAGALPGTLLADTNAATSNFTGALFSKQSGYMAGSYVFAEAGDYTIGFSIVNATDEFFPSGLLVDKVSITAVPEPTALAGLGLCGLALTLRRRRRR